MPARHRPLASFVVRVVCLFCRRPFGSLARFTHHICDSHPALDIDLEAS